MKIHTFLLDFRTKLSKLTQVGLCLYDDLKEALMMPLWNPGTGNKKKNGRRQIYE
jgi:hypothetical protein